MPDCPICLVTFAPDDEIIAYECDPKHYFHAKCALEWLQTKPECPLCRTEFTEKIKKLAALKGDEIQEVAREAALRMRTQQRGASRNSADDEILNEVEAREEK